MLFIFIGTLMMAVGTTQPLHPAMQGFVQGCENIPQPCWYGIVPGETSVAAMTQTLRELGYQPILTSSHIQWTAPNELACDVEAFEEELGMITLVGLLALECDPPFAIGDAIEVFGYPTSLYAPGGSGGVMISFGESQNISASAGSIYDWPTPFTPVHIPALYPRRSTSIQSSHWYGFTTNWRYCQLTNQPNEHCTIR
jgi:hypothetical protein